MELPISAAMAEALTAATRSLQQLSGALHLLHYMRSASALADDQVEAGLWQCVQELTQELDQHRTILQTRAEDA
jgi:hypothetical protein